MWRPLLRAKLGDRIDHVSAAFIWATIARMYKARSGGAKEEAFGYVEGGYARILSRFAAALAEVGVEIRLGAEVERVTAGPAVVADGATERFDKVVVTAASPIASRPLGGYYVTNITDDGFPFTGVIEMTALVDPAELGGRHLVYLPRYTAPGDPTFG